MGMEQGHYHDDHSADTSRSFLDLKRDISNYITRFKNWVAALGLIPNVIVTVYQSMILQTTNEIAGSVPSI